MNVLVLGSGLAAHEAGSSSSYSFGAADWLIVWGSGSPACLSDGYMATVC